MEEKITINVTRYADRPNLVHWFRDPITRKLVTRSSGVTTMKAAYEKAAEWKKELERGRPQADAKLTWEKFRKVYEDEKLVGMSRGTQDAMQAAFNHLERTINPERLASLTSATMSRFQTKLRDEKMREITIATHLRHLKAALGWAVSNDYLATMPNFDRSKVSKQKRTFMRGRPITAEEFERLIAATDKIRPNDAVTWKQYLTGLWLSGLRLEESLIVSWDSDAPFSVDLTGKRPRFRIYAEAQKGQRDELLPMTPDFVAFLLKTPEADWHGLVFKLPGRRPGEQMSRKRVSRTVSAIGKRAGVVVDKADDKYATAHDLRRAFGTRWAKSLAPAMLRKLMRHSSIETTMRYYVDLDSDDIADKLWESYTADGFNTSFNNASPAGEEQKDDLHRSR